MSYNPRDWQEFPQAYFELLDYFSGATGDPTTCVDYLMTFKQAVSRRHDLHKFFRKLAGAYTHDEYARRLSDLANTLTIALEPTRAAPDTAARLVVRRREPFIPNTITRASGTVERPPKDPS